MSPANITATAINSTNIHVMWDSPPLISQNGIITRYEIKYIASMFSAVPLLNSTLASTLTINLGLLEEYAEYSIQVRAYTAEGAGPFSQAVTATTMEDSEICA